MKSVLIRTAGTLALSLLLASSQSLTGQEKEQRPAADQSPLKLAVGTNMVLVPVVVTDKRGHHVSGLHTDDFEVWEDGKSQKIAAFEEITGEAAPVQVPTLPPNTFSNRLAVSHAKNLEIILLDLLNTPAAGRAEARRGLTKFLTRSADSNALMALLVLNATGIHVIHNFTTDTAVLVAAIQQVQAPVASRDAPVLNTNGGDVDAEARQLRAIFAGRAAAAYNGGGPSALVASAIAMLRMSEAVSDASKQDEEALLTLACMQQLAQYFSGIPGRKSLFWASTGFRFSIGSLREEGTRGTSPDDWQRAMRMLQDANIAVYPVDLAGVGLQQPDITLHGRIPAGGGTGDLETARLADPGMAKHLTMDTVASATGGQAFYNFNDSDELLRRAQQDSAQYYLLAYYTRNTDKTGWRKLHVRVASDGVQVRARSGFFFHNAIRDSEATRQADEIMAVTSALESTSIPISGQWQQVEAAGDQRKVHFLLSLSPETIRVDTGHENRLSLDFVLFAWDAEGKQAARIGQRMEKTLSAPEMASVETHGIDYANVLVLPPGEFDVHIVVRDNLTGKLGSVITHLKVE